MTPVSAPARISPTHQAGRLTKLLLRVIRDSQQSTGEATYAVAAVLTQGIAQLQDLRARHLEEMALIEGLLTTLGPKVGTLRRQADRQLTLTTKGGEDDGGD